MKSLIAIITALIALYIPIRAATSEYIQPYKIIQVVAAENFYGELVRALGGPYVSVTSILSNPNQDPHLFEPSAKAARARASAQLVVYNGANYNAWLPKLLTSSHTNCHPRTEIVAAELVGKKPGDNPHLWYLPTTMLAMARAISGFLIQADPVHKADYVIRLTQFIDSLKPINEKISVLKQYYQGTPVTATEPVFTYMAEAIGLEMRNKRFQMSTMNETEPSAADVASFERDLRMRKVKVLIYNSQASDTSTQQMLKIAHQLHVPTVRVTETEPDGKTYQQWMLEQLNALEKALRGQVK
ncbi:metal ABC transporter solute-binding protein, Zn/Mn family [Candidatus Vallotia cooleyia]|uniref:metal ABC transporter solute-binding protein, Zn/Mn family n=1 Tax=Candidatus Vallotiella adelgis TaxID=1177211 RepID=UPI001D003C0F|nr:zinc ABC transporter substrate-binding protein [Candidatus Vallotia cooleyia]UDG82460.1 Manganese ABC transporter substrate-binding lipoprotein [Candidatus Vallotia cooleyia]